MDDIIAWQIKCRRDLCLSGRLFVPLFFHQIAAVFAQLDSRVCMDAVVNTVVAWLVASRHSTVGGIYDCAHF